MKAMHTLVAAAFLAASAAGAQTSTANDHASHHPAGSAAAAAQSEGEVRKVDRERGKVTLRHGAIANLDMPPMTMVFTVVDPKLLAGLKQGDKVRFTADKKDGTYIVTGIEAAR